MSSIKELLSLEGDYDRLKQDYAELLERYRDLEKEKDAYKDKLNQVALLVQAQEEGKL